MLRKLTTQLFEFKFCQLGKNLPLLFSCTPLFFTIACSGSGSGSGNDATDTNIFSLPDTNSALLGSWEGSGCEIGAGSSRNNFLVFNADGTAQQIFRNYAATNCSSLAYTDSAFARFTEGQERILDDGRTITELDFQRIAGRIITPVSTDIAQSFNMTATCGITDWLPEVPREVQSCQFGLFEADAQLLNVAQIYNVTDDYFLYFGNEFIFSTEQRPTQLTPIPSHVRQIQISEGFPADIMGFWRVSGTSFYYELRNNAILVEYLPSQTRTDCFDVTVLATQALGDNQYGAPGTQPIMILPTSTGITFITSTGNTLLEPAAPAQPTDFIPCASLPGG